MSSTSNPFGLRPVYHPSGLVRTVQRTITSGYASAIYEYGPVKIHTDGYINAAAAGDAIIGTFMGCEFTGTNGRRVYSNYWPAAQVASDAICYVTEDPVIVYMIQASGSVTQDDIGKLADFGSANSGSNVTGLSAATLDQGTLSATSGQLRVELVAPLPDNAIGDTYTVMYVQIAEHQYVSNKAGF